MERTSRVAACTTIVILAAVGGCSGPANGPGAPGSDAGGDGAPVATTSCQTYAPTAIAKMRNPATAGCYELAHVALVARTSSTTTPRLYVQDAAGGDYSAIMAKCSSTASHVCTPDALTTSLALLDGESVTIHGYYHVGKNGFEELYVESIVDDGATLPLPAPIKLQVADLQRDARAKAQWFQKASVDVSATDPLVMYDFSPAEFQLTGSCPAWEGFGMIPSSASKPAGGGCAGSSNPPSAAPEPREILVGRQFFHRFTHSSDCACAAAHKQRLVAATATVTGAVSGILILEEHKGSSAVFQVFEPTSNKDFALK